jgi:hypothetical protein
VPLESLGAFIGVERAALRELLDEAARSGWGIEKDDATFLAPDVLPGMGTLRGMKAQKPGPPLVASSPILKVNSPASTQATSSLSRCM